jgi:hypothetical protein
MCKQIPPVVTLQPCPYQRQNKRCRNNHRRIWLKQKKAASRAASKKWMQTIINITGLFADTELRKNIIQLVLSSNLSRDLAEEVETTTYVERNEVAGEVVVHALLYIL